MTKEGETEFLRQQLNQIQTRAENEKKEKSDLIVELEKKYKAEIDRLLKEKSSLESQMQLQVLKFFITHISICNINGFLKFHIH